MSLVKKMRGILDSKGRRAVWEANQTPRDPLFGAHVEQGPIAKTAPDHRPQALADGTLTCCGQRYTPSAHEDHLAGRHVAMTLGDGLRVAGSGDPWLEAEYRAQRARRVAESPDAEAAWRQQLIDAYFAQQQRRRVGQAAGVSKSITD